MKRFKHILCVVEPGEASNAALARAVTLAENNQAKLSVVGVIERITAGIGLPDGGPISTELQNAMAQDYEEQLQPLLEAYRGRIPIQVQILKGVLFLEVIREVLRNGHDLVIKAPQTQDWMERLFGSDDMHLLRKCPCPVWLVKAEAPKAYRCILAAIDIGDGYPAIEVKTRQALSMKILEMSASLAVSEFSELHVVHAWDAAGESVMRGAFIRTPELQVMSYVEQVRRKHAHVVDTLLLELRGKLGAEAMDYLKPKVHLVKGLPRREIPILAGQLKADLVVMGTVARTGVPGFIMGNTAETILNQLECSVLAVKPPGFVTPVIDMEARN